MSNGQIIRVCFLTQDTGLADAVARALGDCFETRASSELRLDLLTEKLAWSHVLLIDLRSNVSQNSDEIILRLMSQLNGLPSHPPMVVLCDEEYRGPFLRSVESGAEDSITNPPNINEL